MARRSFLPSGMDSAFFESDGATEEIGHEKALASNLRGLFAKCPKEDSNLHTCAVLVPETSASTNSAIRALGLQI